MNWLKPFMTRRQCFRGDILFQKDDAADEMYYTVSGNFLLTELGIEVPPGQLVGELGLLSPENRRTATLECVSDGDILTISYEKVRELYFQNPEFGFYFLKLTSERLLQNIGRLEEKLAERPLALRGAAAH
jgi:CRP-like cAMP-binding protein